MKTCAFLSMDDMGDYYVYDDLLIAPMAERGWQVETLSWREKDVDWGRFDAVVLRSCWDYQQYPDEFLCVLAQINQRTLLFNDLDIVRWNISKEYLRDISAAGVPVVPTLWQQEFDAEQVAGAFASFGSEEVIIKPVVSASAGHTYRLSAAGYQQKLSELEAVFSERKHMLQPFIDNVLEEGEFSLFYFDNRFSHAIRKVPKPGDFRVQEEHGGQLYLVQPDPELLLLAEQSLQAIPGKTLYARLDFIRYQQSYRVMELELIEPSLYFNMDRGSPKRFVQALINKVVPMADGRR